MSKTKATTVKKLKEELPPEQAATLEKKKPSKKKVKKTESPSESHEFAMMAAIAALNKKAIDVKVMHLNGVTDMTDYFVVVTAESDAQAKAITDAIEMGLKQNGWTPWHIEGYTNLKWVLMDYVDIVIHVFHKDARGYYNLDNLWGDAPYELITDTPKGIVITPSTDF